MLGSDWHGLSKNSLCLIPFQPASDCLNLQWSLPSVFCRVDPCLWTIVASGGSSTVERPAGDLGPTFQAWAGPRWRLLGVESLSSHHCALLGGRASISESCNCIQWQKGCSAFRGASPQSFAFLQLNNTWATVLCFLFPVGPYFPATPSHYAAL